MNPPEDIELKHQLNLQIQSKLELIEQLAKSAMTYQSTHLMRVVFDEIMILSLEIQLLNKERGI